MTVNPGWGGQPFIPASPDKVAALRALVPEGEIEVDGGIDPKTAGPVAAAGATPVRRRLGGLRRRRPRRGLLGYRTGCGSGLTRGWGERSGPAAGAVPEALWTRQIATHPGLGETRAALRRQLPAVRRRLAMLVLAICILLAAGTIGYVLTEGTSVGFGFVWALDTVATVGSIPEPASSGGQIVKVAADRPRRRYALLRAGNRHRVLRVRPPLGPARGEKGPEEDRLAAAITSCICGFGRVGRQAARDLQAAGREFVVIDSNPAETREHAEGSGRRSSRGRPPTTRCCAAPGLCAPPA